MYELAKHPEHQAELRAEVDTLFDGIGDRALEYRDCRSLPFLTKCVMETLRLWPAVPNGTYRELQFDDFVQGDDGEVKLPKGTFVQVTSWSRHRNKELWGEDALEFNPHRSFTSDETWDGQSFSGFNPSTKRYSPFTFPPRDCIGKSKCAHRSPAASNLL
jgi:cytochrome P450